MTIDIPSWCMGDPYFVVEDDISRSSKNWRGPLDRCPVQFSFTRYFEGVDSFNSKGTKTQLEVLENNPSCSGSSVNLSSFRTILITSLSYNGSKHSKGYRTHLQKETEHNGLRIFVLDYKRVRMAWRHSVILLI